MTRSAKARFGQVGGQVSQVRDQVGQGQGQELDNNKIHIFTFHTTRGTFFRGQAHFIIAQPLPDSLVTTGMKFYCFLIPRLFTHPCNFSPSLLKIKIDGINLIDLKKVTIY